MHRKTLIGLVIGVAALALPALALPLSVLADNNPQIVINVVAANGSSVPNTSATVTVNANGVSLGGTPNGNSNSSVNYTTWFNNSSQTAWFWPGSYSVTVSNISNYSYAYSSGCTGTGTTNSVAYCTVTAYQNGSNNNYWNGNGTLTVYTQIQNQNGSCYGTTYTGYNYNNTWNNCSTWSNGSWPFTPWISVSGNNVTPSSFQGSQSGTVVNVGSGWYSVNPSTQSAWTYTLSGSCSGNLSGNQSQSCTVTYTSTNNNYCWNGNNNSNCNNYPYTGTLSCTPNYQQASVGSTVVLNATGGNGYYTWTNGSYTYNGSGSTLDAQFFTPGPQTVSVTSNGQTAWCTVNVAGNTYYPYNYTTPTQLLTTGYYYNAPHLPNTGYAPVAAWQYALAAALFAVFGGLTIYVRNSLVRSSR